MQDLAQEQALLPEERNSPIDRISCLKITLDPGHAQDLLPAGTIILSTAQARTQSSTIDLLPEMALCTPTEWNILILRSGQRRIHRMITSERGQALDVRIPRMARPQSCQHRLIIIYPVPPTFLDYQYRRQSLTKGPRHLLL